MAPKVLALCISLLSLVVLAPLCALAGLGLVELPGGDLALEQLVKLCVRTTFGLWHK